MNQTNRTEEAVKTMHRLHEAVKGIGVDSTKSWDYGNGVELKGTRCLGL